jgi:hypothetical protein
MQFSSILKDTAVFFLTFLALNDLSLNAEMIEPTRELNDTVRKLGELNVFSEPPKLDVYLNGALKGKTPARLKKLEPGVYKLRIGDGETEVVVLPGKTQQVSFFKGEFILIPTTDKKHERQAPAKGKESTGFKPPSPEAEESIFKDLSPWEQVTNKSLPHL